jgi:hypothetical protein
MSNLPAPLAQPVDLRPNDNSLSLGELWLRCYALGSMNTKTQLGAFLRGELHPTRHEYNVIAVAMNEYLIDIGVAQFVPYFELPELAGAQRCSKSHRSVDPATW